MYRYCELSNLAHCDASSGLSLFFIYLFLLMVYRFSSNQPIIAVNQRIYVVFASFRLNRLHQYQVSCGKLHWISNTHVFKIYLTHSTQSIIMGIFRRVFMNVVQPQQEERLKRSGVSYWKIY